MLVGIVISLAVIASVVFVAVKKGLFGKAETAVNTEISKVESGVKTEVKHTDEAIIGRLKKI